jgi:hypothetical protein
MKARYNHWKVESSFRKIGKFRYRYCQCDCGKSCWVREYDLLSGKSKACKECAKRKMWSAIITHGETRNRKQSREYRAYHDMIRRCTDESRNDYKYYGGAGIRVCWWWMESFENFLMDMGRCPENWTLDRIDNDLGYNKGNCRWATRSVQANNTRVVGKFSIGPLTHTITEWAHIAHMNRGTLASRLRRGNNINEAISWNP